MLLDGIHAYGDVLSYPDPAFGRWAWFVPVEFGLLGAGVCLIAPAVEARIAPGWTPPWSLLQRIGEVVLFAAFYLCSALVDGHDAWPVVLALGLAVVAIARVALGNSPGDWLYALVAAVAGPIAESTLISLDVFSYAHPDIAHVPIWLAPLWANGGLMIRRVVVPIALGSDVKQVSSSNARSYAG